MLLLLGSTGILAERQAPIDGFVSLAGAGRPVGQLLIEQISAKLTPAQLASLNKAVADLEAGVLPGPLGPPLDPSHPLKQSTWDPLQQKAAYGDPSVPLATGLSEGIATFLSALP